MSQNCHPDDVEQLSAKPCVTRGGFCPENMSVPDDIQSYGNRKQARISPLCSQISCFLVLLLLHLLPTLTGTWKVHPPPGSSGKNERKEGSASSCPSDRCGDPGSRGLLSLPPLPWKRTPQSYREEVKPASQCHFWGYLYTHGAQGLGVALSMRFIH